MMDVFHSLYSPSIRWVMHHKGIVVITAIFLFGSSMFILNKLGGEFIPTLEEGDFAVETRVLIGSSLENTIEATTKAEKIILEQFPEVIQIVSKIHLYFSFDRCVGLRTGAPGAQHDFANCCAQDTAWSYPL